MQIKYDDDIILNLNVEKKKDWTMGADAGYTQFVLAKRGDVEKELGCFKALLNTIPKSNKVIDVMSGAGFTAKLVEKYWAADLILNDFSEECYEVLCNNFPESPSYNMDGLQLLEGLTFSTANLVWIDFNNFAWKKREKYIQWFEKAALVSDKLLFTDSSIYGMSRFGGKNLKVYGIDCIEQYWMMLNDWIKRFGFHIHYVSYFSSASFIYATKEESSKIHICESYPLQLTEIKAQKGLFHE